MSITRMRLESDAEPTAAGVHECPRSGNLWTWVAADDGGHWQRDLDDHVAPYSLTVALDGYDAKHPVTKEPE